jgi:hypothetical protein
MNILLNYKIKAICLMLLINLSLSQKFLSSETKTNNNTCTLECTVASIAVYWAAAGICIYELAPTSCITSICPLVVLAFDLPCLAYCKKSGFTEKGKIQFAQEFVKENYASIVEKKFSPESLKLEQTK